MINELYVDGFRGLDGLVIAPLGRVNLIVGPGNSGKTNLLESAFLFCSTGDPGLIQRVLALRGITSSHGRRRGEGRGNGGGGGGGPTGTVGGRPAGGPSGLGDARGSGAGGGSNLRLSGTGD